MIPKIGDIPLYGGGVFRYDRRFAMPFIFEGSDIATITQSAINVSQLGGTMFELRRRLAIAAFFMAFVGSACRPFSSSEGGSGGTAGGPMGMGGGAGTGSGGGQGGDGGRDAVGGNGGMGNGGGGSGGEGGATIAPRRILGLAYDTNANHWSTVQTDPNTGVLSTLSILPSLTDGVAQGMSTFHASTQQIYHLGGQNTLLVIDATSGALTNTISLGGGIYSGVLNLETNLAGEVIGLAWDSTALHFDVVRVDVTSGALVPLASLPSQYTGLAQAIGTFDALTNQMYEVTGENTLLVIDAATGALNGAISLNLGDYSGLMNIEANNAGEILGLAYDNVAAQFDVVRVDTATSSLVPLAPVPQISSGLAQGMGTFDPISNRMFELTGDGDLLIIDGTSGTPLGAIPILLGNYSGVMNLEAVP